MGIFLILLWFYSTPSYAQVSCPDGHKPDDLIVTWEASETSVFSKIKNSRALGKTIGYQKSKQLRPFIFFTNLRTTTSSLDEIPGKILHSEPNCLYKMTSLPDDPYFEAQWSHRLAGWQPFKDKMATIVVAVSDNGVDYRHPDLAEQIFSNSTEELGLAGWDDDQNGCIDDFHGCDFAELDGDPSPSKGNDSQHGTHVAGIISATFNNQLGVVGVANNVRLLSVKGFGDDGAGGDTFTLLRTIYYAMNMGARIINLSWTRRGIPLEAEKAAFKNAEEAGVVIVAAAGNDAADASGYTPASLDTVISVGSVNSLGNISSFSNFGKDVLIYAPGGEKGEFDEWILSTAPEENYSYLRGTSMSAPYVSGAGALALGINPDLSPLKLREIIRNSSHPEIPDTPVLYLPKLVALAKDSLTDSGEGHWNGCGEECGFVDPAAGTKTPASVSQGSCGFAFQANEPLSTSAIRLSLWILALLLPLAITSNLRK